MQKNSVLPVIAGSLLCNEPSIIEDVPNLNDVCVMCDLLRAVGAGVDFSESEKSIRVNPSSIWNSTAPYELVNKMRASFLVMGPLLVKTGIAEISLPGGCPIGTRPVDLHLKGFALMGADISQEHGYIEVKVNGRL